MSLVVAEIHDGGISLVGDTRVTHQHDDSIARHDLENATPKLLILRDDVCVGFAGNGPEHVTETLIAERDRPIDDLLALTSDMPHASFVVAHLSGTPRLWQVNDGVASDRTAIGRAWAGDPGGYGIFQERCNDWPPGTDVAFVLLSSLQWLLTWGQVPSIGGYHTRVATTETGFRYVADATVIGPEEMRGIARLDPGGSLSLRLATTPGGDRSLLNLECAVGRGPTFGALAYLAGPSGFAILFPHDAPSVPVILRANSIAELIERAAEAHAQLLAGS